MNSWKHRALIGAGLVAALVLVPGCKKEEKVANAAPAGSASAAASAAAGAGGSVKQKPIHVAYYAIPG